MRASRREFLGCAGAGAITRLVAGAQRTGAVLVEAVRGGDFHEKLAEQELLRGLRQLRLPAEVRLGEAGAGDGSADTVFRLRVDAGRWRGRQEYEIAARGNSVTLTGADGRSLLNSVFDFLERQGAFFGIDGESYPADAARGLSLPAAGEPWAGEPRFAQRGLLPWPDFLNCISVYNEEDFLAYFEAMLRMRFNLFGMHVYTGGDQWAESYLSFDFAGAGHIAHLDTTATRRWGYLPVRTSRFTMGASQFYDREVFGADATRLSRDPWETAEATQAVLAKAFAYAKKLGIRTGIGFEPYQIPDEIWRALPPEVRPEKLPERGEVVGRWNVESVTARKLLETRLAQLLEAYPDIDYVWLWEDEQMNWESRRTGIPLSVTPFLQAHDFLRRHAPDKRLVVSGWGGVARHFESFHERLPGDIIFSCLSDSLGWDPVDEVFGKLGDRERWPIPWLEDDPGMWQAQFHAHRFQRDVDRAADFGCQGMLGIHWRHRIVDPTAGYFSRAMWDENLAPGGYYEDYAGTQASGDRSTQLARLLTDVDKNNLLLSTWTGETKDGHAVTQQFSGDYNEAFTYWRDYTPSAKVVASQKEVLAELRALLAEASTEAECERLGYLTGHVAFLVPYAECWTLANRLHRVLEKAGELKRSVDADEARRLVAEEGVPLWLDLAGEVRRAMLAYQRVVATRNDLGTLASKHIKFVRLALYRLPLSIQEYLGEIPAEMEQAFAAATAPDTDCPPRLILPTRPGLLERGTRTRIMVVAPGEADVRQVLLHLKTEDTWESKPAEHLGRRTYAAFLGPFESGKSRSGYYVSARVGGQTLTAPAGAPAHYQHLTLV